MRKHVGQFVEQRGHISSTGALVSRSGSAGTSAAQYHGHVG
ncbi:MAG TPA: hypothetical protein VGL80_10520 [Pseudonocardiaceae bacterium]